MIAFFPLVGIFQSTPSAWRVTSSSKYDLSKIVFQSTPSAWRVTSFHEIKVIFSNISIHTLRVEGDQAYRIFDRVVVISIHTLRVEGDANWKSNQNHQAEISIHTLRVEGDCKSAQKSRTLLFKSNRPAEKLPTGRA